LIAALVNDWIKARSKAVNMKTSGLARILFLCAVVVVDAFVNLSCTSNIISTPTKPAAQVLLCVTGRYYEDQEDIVNCDQRSGKHVSANDADSNSDADSDSISRREFIAWNSAAATLSAFYNPTMASAKNPSVQGSGKLSDQFDPSIPFSSTRQYNDITLSNGLQVLLVSDKSALRASAALTIRGAGQFSDPKELGGLAHLMEHMILSANSRKTLSRKAQDFEEWLSDFDGASNGFTAYEHACFHFNAPPEVFLEALDRFAGLFLQEVIEKVCKNEDTLKREIRRVNLELDFSNGFTQELYLVKSLLNPDHPYSRFTAGSLQTLEIQPAAAGIDVGKRLYKFFEEQYLPSRAVLVVISPNDLSSLEFGVAPFATTLSRNSKEVGVDSQRIFPAPFTKQNRITPICLFRSKNDFILDDKIERLTFQWALALDYSEILVDQTSRPTVTASQIGFVLSQVMARKGPGSLYLLLKRRGWIPEGSQSIPRITFPVDVSGFQLMKLELHLTLEGFVSRSAVIAAVYDSINSLQTSSLSRSPFALRRELISEYATVAQLYGCVLAPRPPDSVELAFDGQFYGVKGPNGIRVPEWRRFPSPQDYGGVISVQKCLAGTLQHMSDPSNAIIITTASKKAILTARTSLFDNLLPLMSPASWNIAPRTGARYYFDDVFRLSGKANEWFAARLMEDELSGPVLNPLIPPILRPARIPTDTSGSEGLRGPLVELESRASFLSLLSRKNRLDDEETTGANFGDPTRSSIVRDSWTVLQVIPFGSQITPHLPLPRMPPEPSCRCAFVLQLLSSRPARANVEMAAHAELWKVSFAYSVADLAELGAPAGLAYELSFNKFGMRICFLGLSQNIASYARRICRRLVDHQTRLLEGSDTFPSAVVDSAARNSVRIANISPQRTKLILNLLRESSATEAALEAISLFQSCSGGVCISQGDMLPKETAALLGDLKGIFRSVTGVNVKPVPASPEIQDIIYQPVWIPRSASLCSIAGASFVSDPCGRVPR
jgi:insulysin